jgi:hypothetical protein
MKRELHIPMPNLMAVIVWWVLTAVFTMLFFSLDTKPLLVTVIEWFITVAVPIAAGWAVLKAGWGRDGIPQ